MSQIKGTKKLFENCNNRRKNRCWHIDMSHKGTVKKNGTNKKDAEAGRSKYT